jgi:hypothetical protein
MGQHNTASLKVKNTWYYWKISIFSCVLPDPQFAELDVHNSCRGVARA